jgi:hypothetical protein
MPDCFQRIGHADLRTLAALDTFGAVKYVAPVLQTVTALGADISAFHTSNALFSIKEKLLLFGLGLRVVAPQAIQRTPFVKNSASNSGTVVDGEFLYIENRSFYHSKQPSYISISLTRKQWVYMFNQRQG